MTYTGLRADDGDQGYSAGWWVTGDLLIWGNWGLKGPREAGQREKLSEVLQLLTTKVVK